jgi:hypothetical protein
MERKLRGNGGRKLEKVVICMLRCPFHATIEPDRENLGRFESYHLLIGKPRISNFTDASGNRRLHERTSARSDWLRMAATARSSMTVQQ